MKNFVKNFLIVLLELILISFLLVFIAQKRGVGNLAKSLPANIAQMAVQEAPQEVEQPFPEVQQPGVKNFAWSFKGVKYRLSLKLDQAVYAYYQKQPKQFSYQGELPANWEESYYGMFLKINKKDKTIEQLVGELRKLGKEHNLNDDQIVELALAFVQAISYDDSKANNILAQTGSEQMLYPFETLFAQKGVCSDKSMLMIAILRELGYGAAIFAYEAENHMAVGVQCPQADSTYGSGYCFSETTSVGHKIGVIPQIDPKSNKTVEVSELATFQQENQQQQNNLRELGKVTILQATKGKEYTGVAANEKLRFEIDALKVKMQSFKTQLAGQIKSINQKVARLEDQKKQIDELKNMLNPGKYAKTIDEYNALVGEYEKDLKTYNQTVGLYNQAVARYNKLIKQ